MRIAASLLALLVATGAWAVPTNNAPTVTSTDCAALTDGVPGEVCYETDVNRLYICDTADTCNSSAEWKIMGSGETIYLPDTGDIGALVNAAPEYTTFYMVPGATYDLTTWSAGMNLKTGQTLDGRGAVISGAYDITPGSANCAAWTHTVGPPEYWSCGSIPDFLETDPSDPDTCSGVYTSAPYSHGNTFCLDGILWVFPNYKRTKTSADFGEAALAQAGSKSRVEGTTALWDANDPYNEFYWSTVSNVILLNEDPTDKSIVVNHGYGSGGTTHVYAIRMGSAPFTGSVSTNITVKNLTVQFLASTPHNNGAIHTGRCNNCLIDNVRVRFNQGNGIACFESDNFELKNSYLTDNTNTGYQGCWLSQNENVHDNVLARNGIGGYEVTFGPGNTKLAGSSGTRFYRNKVLDAGFLQRRTNTNPSGLTDQVEGVWLDTQSSGWVVENNYIARSGSKGIYAEVSCNGTIRYNYLVANRVGINIGSSHDIMVENNIVDVGQTGIQVVEDPARTADFDVILGETSTCGPQPWDGNSTGITVRKNSILAPSNRSYSTSYGTSIGSVDPADNVVFEKNCYDLYWHNGPNNPARFYASTNYNHGGSPFTYYTFAQWQSVFGMDADVLARELHDAPNECLSGQQWRLDSLPTGQTHVGDGVNSPSDGD